MRGLVGSAYTEPVPRRLVSANFGNASRIRAFGLRSYFWTQRVRTVPAASVGEEVSLRFAEELVRSKYSCGFPMVET